MSPFQNAFPQTSRSRRDVASACEGGADELDEVGED